MNSKSYKFFLIFKLFNSIYNKNYFINLAMLLNEYTDSDLCQMKSVHFVRNLKTIVKDLIKCTFSN